MRKHLDGPAGPGYEADPEQSLAAASHEFFRLSDVNGGALLESCLGISRADIELIGPNDHYVDGSVAKTRSSADDDDGLEGVVDRLDGLADELADVFRDPSGEQNQLTMRNLKRPGFIAHGILVDASIANSALERDTHVSERSGIEDSLRSTALYFATQKPDGTPTTTKVTWHLGANVTRQEPTLTLRAGMLLRGVMNLQSPVPDITRLRIHEMEYNPQDLSQPTYSTGYVIGDRTIDKMTAPVSPMKPLQPYLDDEFLVHPHVVIPERTVRRIPTGSMRVPNLGERRVGEVDDDVTDYLNLIDQLRPETALLGAGFVRMTRGELIDHAQRSPLEVLQRIKNQALLAQKQVDALTTD